MTCMTGMVADLGGGGFWDGCLFHGPVHTLLVDKHPLDCGPEKHREDREGLPVSGDPSRQEGSQTCKQLW